MGNSWSRNDEVEGEIASLRLQITNLKEDKEKLQRDKDKLERDVQIMSVDYNNTVKLVRYSREMEKILRGRHCTTLTLGKNIFMQYISAKI